MAGYITVVKNGKREIIATTADKASAVKKAWLVADKDDKVDLGMKWSGVMGDIKGFEITEDRALEGPATNYDEQDKKTRAEWAKKTPVERAKLTLPLYEIAFMTRNGFKRPDAALLEKAHKVHLAHFKAHPEAYYIVPIKLYAEAGLLGTNNKSELADKMKA